MKRPRSVAQLTTLLCVYVGYPIPFPITSITYRSCIDALVGDGLIYEYPYTGQVQSTQKGDAFVAALRHTPDPVQTWTAPGRES